MNKFDLPKSPYTEEQTRDMKVMLEQVVPWVEQQLKDAKAAGLDTTEQELQYNKMKDQLVKLVKVYGGKYG